MSSSRPLRCHCQAMPIPVQAPLPDSCLVGENSVIGARFAWLLILVLLCKLDGKTEHLQRGFTLISIPSEQSTLRDLKSPVFEPSIPTRRGLDCQEQNEGETVLIKLRKNGIWSKVLSTLPDPTAAISRDVAKECFLSFNSAFEATYRLHSSWVVSDGNLRDEIKVSLCKRLVSAYKVFYDKYRVVLRRERNFETVVKYSPDDLGNYLSDLFYVNSISGGSSSVHLS